MASVRHLGLFPWCVPKGIDGLIAFLGLEYSYLAEYAQGAGSAWPVAFTRDQAMNLFWRVKSIRVTSPQAIVSQVGKVDPAFTSETEKDLVCFANTEMETTVQARETIVTELANNDTRIDTVEGFFSITWRFMFFDESIGKYWMPVRVTFFDSTTNPPGLSLSDYILNGDGTERAGDSIDFFGVPLTLGENSVANTCGNSGNEPCAQFAAGTVEAAEYWPYNPEDGGGPIYDSATGAQLRAFPA